MSDMKRLRDKAIPFEVKIKQLITAMHLNCIGTVAAVNDDGSRIDVNLPYLDCNEQIVSIKGVEVLRPGTHLVKIKVKPEIGDVVLLFAQQSYWSKVLFGHTPIKATTSCNKYNDATIKAILVQTNEDNDDATLIDIKEDTIEITAPLKTTIVCKDEVNITCEASVAVDASDQEVSLKASKVTINDHLTVE